MAKPSSRRVAPSATGQSLMPEGLEAGLSPEDMADLLRFIEDLAVPNIRSFTE